MESVPITVGLALALCGAAQLVSAHYIADSSRDHVAPSYDFSVRPATAIVLRGMQLRADTVLIAQSNTTGARPGAAAARKARRSTTASAWATFRRSSPWWAGSLRLRFADVASPPRW